MEGRCAHKLIDIIVITVCAVITGMVRRGLRIPTLITTDGAPGLIAAVEQVWPRSLRQRCLAHKKRNVLDKAPDSAREEVKAALNGVYCAATRQVTDLLTTRFLKTYDQRCPSAVACFTDGLEVCLALKLVFATLWNVRMSDAECALLDRLRRELGLDDKEAQPITTTKPNPVEVAA